MANVNVWKDDEITHEREIHGINERNFIMARQGERVKFSFKFPRRRPSSFS
jgi:hypothetical protein